MVCEDDSRYLDVDFNKPLAEERVFVFTCEVAEKAVKVNLVYEVGIVPVMVFMVQRRYFGLL